MGISRIIKSNKGSSIILVAALSVVIIGVTVSLRIMAGIIMASANHQLNQDQAYELAVSLGNRLEEQILNGNEEKKALLELRSGEKLVDMSSFEGMPDASVTAEVAQGTGDRYTLTVHAEVGEAVYNWTGIYQGSASEGYKKCAD
ncbi:MAG: hypothetical protein IJ600_00315 [Lachnospiraceae bacterium]|nr:hypothetical protein [Lachnospiraceae bacterium]